MASPFRRGNEPLLTFAAKVVGLWAHRHEIVASEKALADLAVIIAFALQEAVNDAIAVKTIVDKLRDRESKGGE